MLTASSNKQRSVFATAPTGEARFFAMLVAVVALITLVGFGLNAVLGRVRHADVPIMIYLHALACAAWLILAIVQPWLIVTRARQLHRRLGWLGVVLAVAVVALGFNAIIVILQRGAQPAGVVLLVNGISLVGFGLLVATGLAMRRTTGWHSRLMVSAAILLSAPAFARLLPLQWFGSAALFAIATAVSAIFAAGVIHDRRVRGKIHPAWYIGLAIVLANAALPGPLGFLPPVATYADGLAIK